MQWVDIFTELPLVIPKAIFMLGYSSSKLINIYVKLKFYSQRTLFCTCLDWITIVILKYLLTLQWSFRSFLQILFGFYYFKTFGIICIVDFFRSIFDLEIRIHYTEAQTAFLVVLEAKMGYAFM